MDNKQCYLCSSSDTIDFFHMPEVPTQDGVMCNSKRSAEAVIKGNIELRFCNYCGYIGNEGYDSGKISFDSYDFSLDHSPLFTQFQEMISNELIKRYNLNHKTILDIGCGDGRFLQLICKKGNNKGLGIDSGFDHSKRKVEPDIDITFLQDYYSKKQKGLKADFIACRLVIDLLGDPVSFLKMVRNNLESQPDTIVYFEVPNASYTFENKIIWNVVYEHRSWFTKKSIRYFFENCGFEVLNVYTCWNEEFLSIEAKACQERKETFNTNSKYGENFSNTIENFKEDFSTLITQSEDKIDWLIGKKLKTIAWGAGARGLTFFNLFDLKDKVPFIVDINHKRQGKFLPGGAQQIVPPEFIIDYQPELVIITNPTYAQEIMDHVSRLGVKSEFWVL